MTVKDRGNTMVRRGSASNNGAAAGRGDALKTAQQRQPVQTTVDYAQTSVSDIFGSNVFNRATMRSLLPKNVYKALVRLKTLLPNISETEV